MSGVLVAIVGALSGVVVAAITLLGVRVQARSQQTTGAASVGATELIAAVQTWQQIAERAEIKADEAIRRSSAAEYEARTARELNERLQQDTVALVSYLHATWAGVLTKRVPPHLPIPDRLRHLLSDTDFPPPND